MCGNGIVEDNEVCDGEPCCNADCTFAPPGQACRVATGPCDRPEVCTGTTLACPADEGLSGPRCDDGNACTLDDQCELDACVGNDVYEVEA